MFEWMFDDEDDTPHCMCACNWNSNRENELFGLRQTHFYAHKHMALVAVLVGVHTEHREPQAKCKTNDRDGKWGAEDCVIASTTDNYFNV